MTSDRWPEVERLYHAALERPVEDRAAYLDEACAGDTWLRREVASLVEHDEAAGAFLERPAVEDVAAGMARATPRTQPSIAGYRILQVLGEGGMGTVYLAEQETPLRRRVALKLIRPGLDSPQVVARFELERQALALMDHPNIAAVYDAGTTSDGRPYVAMEYVEGVPITTYCDRERLPPPARLELFIATCAAVQHAHQKGVIHRDLKPSNVLVAVQDGRPVPKIIDFGTAKAVEPSWARRDTLTSHGLVLGTLEYMSPEQASLSRDIDTATDVYSLGVLLYELLVGTVPFDRRASASEGYDEIRRQIRETDPPKPSQRLAADERVARAVADSRATDVSPLSRYVKGDLDAIVLKALEKDRRRRYPTVAAFARDVQRFLSDEPVEARPPSTAYRIAKFARRYRGAVSATATVMVVLVAGLATSSVLYFRAERALADANERRVEAETQRRLADAERATAERATGEALAANREAIRQGDLATREAVATSMALRESEYRAYLASIAAADGELNANLPRAAQARLLSVPASLRGWEWHHLYLRTDSSLFTLSADPCSPAERLDGHERERTESLLLDADGSHLLWSRCDRIDRWDVATHAHRSIPVPDRGRILAIDSAGRIVVLSSDRADTWTLRLIDSAAGRTMAAFGPFGMEPACADISPTGTHIAVGFDPPDSSAGEPLDDVFEVWSADTVQLVTRVRPPRPSQFDTRARFYTSCMVRFSRDGRRIASSGSRVHLWAVGSGVELHADTTQAGRTAQPIAFNGDGTLLAIGRPSGLVDVVDLSSEATLIHLDGGDDIRALPLPDRERRLLISSRSQDEASAVAFATDNSKLVSSFGTHVVVWDLGSRRLVKLLEGHLAPVTAVRLGADGRVVYSGDRSGTVRIWPAGASTGITRLPGDSSQARPIAVSSDSDVVAVTGMDASLSAWHLGDARQTVLRPGAGVILRGVSRAIAASPDGRHVLSAEDGTTVHVTQWTLATKAAEVVVNEVAEPPCQPPPPRVDTYVSNLAFSPDGRYLAYSYGVCIAVRDMARRARAAVFTLAIPSERETSLQWVAFRHDGALVTITGHATQPGLTARNLVRVWDWRSGRALVTRGTPAGVTGLRNWKAAWSGDGTRIALYGGSPGMVAIWDHTLSREIARVVGSASEPGALDRGDFEAVALSHDGRRMATVGRDKVVRIWDATRLQPVLTLPDIDKPLGGLAFTRDGRLVAGRSSGGLTVWESLKPACAACAATGDRE